MSYIMSKEERLDLLASKAGQYLTTRESISDALDVLDELAEYGQRATDAVKAVAAGRKAKPDETHRLGNVDEDGYRELVEGLERDRAKLLSLHEWLVEKGFPLREPDARYGGTKPPSNEPPRR